MPILSGHSHPRNLCILPRRIYYALVEQVQQERIFYPFVFAPLPLLVCFRLLAWLIKDQIVSPL